MINRGNWQLTKSYLEYRRNIERVVEGTLKLDKTYLRYLLFWAWDRPFSEAPKIRPTLPEFLLTARLDNSKKGLSPSSVKRALTISRNFFEWLKDEKRGYSLIKKRWLVSLSIKTEADPTSKKKAVTIEEIRAISKAPVENTQERRIRAAAVFLYLSGIRISAFVSLPLMAVDIPNKKIKQLPELGVRTKNRKRATTSLLPIPDLLEVIQDWDNEVRAVLPAEGYWFAPLYYRTGEIDKNNLEIGDNRQHLARKNLRAWLEKVGLPYHSPHEFRHGHIHWGRDHSIGISDFKAVSKNVMHKSLQITDEVYSNFQEDDLRDRIEALAGNEINQNTSQDEQLIDLLEQLLIQLKKGQ